MHVLTFVSAIAKLVHVLAYDPWDPEEALFILAWMAGVRPVLQLVHRAVGVARRAAGAPPPPAFEASLLGRAVRPLRQLGWAFWALWAFDNGLALARLAGASVDRASPLLAGTPSAIYFIWAGVVCLHIQDALFAAAAARDAASGADAGGSSGVRTRLQRALGLATVCATAAVAGSAVGVDPRTLLGIGGLLGFASSLAVKDVLTNLFSGLSLAVHRPFAEGDEVIFGALNAFRVTARVVKLGYFQTVLKDDESQLIYVPNGALTNQTISNAGRRTHTRVAGEFAVRYADVPRLEALLADARAELRTLPQLDEGPAPVAVTVAGFQPQGVSLKVTAMFSRRGPLNRDALRSATWLAVARAVERQGCAFAAAPPA